MSNSVWPHRRQPTRLPRPWDSPGKNTGVGCHSFSNAWKWKVKGKSLSHVQLLATAWTAAHQAPPSMGDSRQEYRSGLPSPSPTLSWIKPNMPLLLTDEKYLNFSSWKSYFTFGKLIRCNNSLLTILNNTTILWLSPFFKLFTYSW